MLIEVKNLTKEFDKEKIFSNVFFSIEDGYKVAFLKMEQGKVLF